MPARKGTIWPTPGNDGVRPLFPRGVLVLRSGRPVSARKRGTVPHPPPAEPIPTAAPGLLARLGLYGLASIEPVLLAALVSGEPLLLVGPHGTGKSYLLARLAQTLGLAWRHYNASLLNYDDLVGYPLPDGNGGLDFVRTPASIWGAQAVFFDEISRCRPDMQNKLFPILHERRVQGLLLERLVYRWSAMNPPWREDQEGPAYRGSEALDQALADRFALIVDMPDWATLDEEVQEQIILATDEPPGPAACAELKARLAAAQSLLPALARELNPALAAYVRLVVGLLGQGGTALSPRRAGMLLRNIVAVHAARLTARADAEPADSALLALTHSLPQRALEEKPPDRVKLLAAHRQAWQAVRLAPSDPRRWLLLEPDPLRRALRAASVAGLSPAEFSGLVADALASLPPGGRHALALELFESGAAGRLVAAVADQCGELYALVVTPQALNESVHSGSTRHQLWQRLLGVLAGLDAAAPETERITNLLVGLFGAGQLATDSDLDRALASWCEVRQRVREAAA
jgi:MoxR-like ATPase